MPQDFIKYFTDITNQLKSEHRYREFVDISRLCKDFPYAINNKNGHKVVLWCSNDYLAMGQNIDAINASKKAIDDFGVGSGGTRNISGTHNLISKLESLIASIHNKESAIVFSSGYVANDATIQSIVKIIPNLIIFSDENNHSSIISGIKNSRAQKHIFKHNNIDNLEHYLKQYPTSQPKLIISESVYSMDGDFGKILEISQMAKKYNAISYVDEVHGVGVYGDNGGGLCRELNIDHDIDIIQGTFAKAFGVVGGYITGKREVIDAIRCVASGFIFSTSLPPSIIAAIIANVNHLAKSNDERKNLQKNLNILKSKLLQADIPIVCPDSQIISIAIGNALIAKEISRSLLDDYNIYIQHINYPTVAINDERLRITITPLHTIEMINELVLALKTLLNIYFNK